MHQQLHDWVSLGLKMAVACRMPTKGYCFATWLRIEEAPRPQPGHPGPTGQPGHPGAAGELDRALYSLLSREPGGVKGICALLRGDDLQCCTMKSPLNAMS